MIRINRLYYDYLLRHHFLVYQSFFNAINILNFRCYMDTWVDRKCKNIYKQLPNEKLPNEIVYFFFATLVNKCLQKNAKG